MVQVEVKSSKDEVAIDREVVQKRGIVLPNTEKVHGEELYFQMLLIHKTGVCDKRKGLDHRDNLNSESIHFLREVELVCTSWSSSS